MAWIRESLESQQARMTQEASGLLAAAAGSNLWLLDNEINKLINYKKALGQHGKDTLTLIDIEDIRLLCQGQRELSIFPLTDAISSRNKRLAVKIIEEQLDADIPESYLLNMITRQFKVILQIREAIDNGSSTKKIISTLKIHPYVVQKGVVQARNFNIKYLKNVMKKLIEIDFSMKSGLSDIKTELSVLIAAL